MAGALGQCEAGQKVKLKREVGDTPHHEASKARPSGLDVAQEPQALAWLGSILSREQLSTHDWNMERECDRRCGNTEQSPWRETHGMDLLQPGNPSILTRHLGRLPGGGSPEAVSQSRRGGGRTCPGGDQ